MPHDPASEETKPGAPAQEDEGSPARPPLPPAAARALVEAQERRRVRDEAAQAAAAEIGGRAGPDPVRYGDWESGGIASDF